MDPAFAGAPHFSFLSKAENVILLSKLLKHGFLLYLQCKVTWNNSKWATSCIRNSTTALVQTSTHATLKFILSGNSGIATLQLTVKPDHLLLASSDLCCTTPSTMQTFIITHEYNLMSRMHTRTLVKIWDAHFKISFCHNDTAKLGYYK